MSAADFAEGAQVRDLRLKLAVDRDRPAVLAIGLRPLFRPPGALLRLFQDQAGSRLRLTKDFFAALGGVLRDLTAVFLRVGYVLVGGLLRPR